MEDRHERLEEHSDAFHLQAHPEASPTSAVRVTNLVGRCSPLSGVTLYKWLTWSSYNDQVRKKATKRLGMLGYLLNRRSVLSIANGVLIYRLFKRAVMEYAWRIWKSAARCHVRKLQVSQSRCLRIASVNLGTSVTGKFMMIWEFRFSPTI